MFNPITNTMKIKKALIVICLSIWVSGCVTHNIAYHTNERIKQINIGMTKSEVIGFLGQKYMISSSSKDEKGKLTEVLSYKSDSSEEYHLKFTDDKLIEWKREHINRYVVPDQAPVVVK